MMIGWTKYNWMWFITNQSSSAALITIDGVSYLWPSRLWLSTGTALGSNCCKPKWKRYHQCRLYQQSLHLVVWCSQSRIFLKSKLVSVHSLNYFIMLAASLKRCGIYDYKYENHPSTNNLLYLIQVKLRCCSEHINTSYIPTGYIRMLAFIEIST